MTVEKPKQLLQPITTGADSTMLQLMADKTHVGVETPATGLASESGRCTDDTAQTIQLVTLITTEVTKEPLKMETRRSYNTLLLEKGYNRNVTM